MQKLQLKKVYKIKIPITSPPRDNYANQAEILLWWMGVCECTCTYVNLLLNIHFYHRVSIN